MGKNKSRKKHVRVTPYTTTALSWYRPQQVDRVQLLQGKRGVGNRDDEDDYIIIGGAKVYVNSRGLVSGVLVPEHVVGSRSSVQEEVDNYSESSTTSVSDLDDYIESLNLYEGGPGNVSSDDRFNEYFQDLDLGNDGGPEDVICGEDDSDEEFTAPKEISKSRIQLWRDTGVYGKARREKKKKVTRKRLQRSNNRGFSLSFVVQRIEDFVEEEGDMVGFPPLSKFERKQLQKLASFYQCTVTYQGSGTKKICILHATRNTKFPTAKDREEIDRMLALEKEAMGLHSHAPATQPKLPSKTKSKSKVILKKEERRLSSSIKFVSNGSIDPNKDGVFVEEAHSLQPVPATPIVEKPASPAEKTSYSVEKLNFEQHLRKSQALMTAKELKQSEKKRKKELRRMGRSAEREKSIKQEHKNSISSPSNAFGAFERHTSGVGSKLLAKWGYQGQGSGLGKTADGIAEPLRVEVRTKRLGLGA